MQGIQRKIVHAVLFEVFAIISATLMFMAAADHDALSSGGLAVLTSVAALLWNMAYNAAFERWEKRQITRGRSLKRRIVHAIGFEGGLVVILLPLIAWWLEISIARALGLEIGMVLFFVIYGFVYNWCFDHVFGLPDSAKPIQ